MSSIDSNLDRHGRCLHYLTNVQFRRAMFAEFGLDAAHCPLCRELMLLSADHTPQRFDLIPEDPFMPYRRILSPDAGYHL